MAASPTYQLFVGIDIAAKSAAVAIIQPDAAAIRPFNVPQSPAGFALLSARLKQTGVAPDQTMIVLEATGAYWVQLALYLHQTGFVLGVVNPKQAHDYSKSWRLPGKTDFLDAAALASLAQKHIPPAWTPPPAAYHQLAQRIAQRAHIGS